MKHFEQEIQTPLSLFTPRFCQENQDELTAGFSSRQAGNVALYTGDDPDRVRINRKNLVHALQWDEQAFTCADQVHGSRVHVVTKADIGAGRDALEEAILATDALVTAEANVLLVMFYADCVPLYFFDPLTQVVALAHAGWKGTVKQIAAKTIMTMKEAFNVKSDHIQVAIGPSIGSCCYEVDDGVLNEVQALGLRQELFLNRKPLGKAKLDLKLLNRQIMLEAGILAKNIEVSSWCTSCRTDLFFSYRQERGQIGRMMSWLGRKSD